MKENFKTILQAFNKAGLKLGSVQFSITEYSLNTELSFKFENLDDFLAFLHFDGPADENKAEDVSNAVIETGLDPENFFYVNFYKPEVTEL